MLPQWPSRRKSNKKRARSKVARVFMSGATAALIRERFPNQKGVVVSESAPMPKDLMDISLEEFDFSADQAPEIIPPDILPVFEITPELELEKEKSAVSRSKCLRSTVPGRTKRRKGTKKRRDMIEEGTYYSDESSSDSIEDGCLLLGLTQDMIDLD